MEDRGLLEAQFSLARIQGVGSSQFGLNHNISTNDARNAVTRSSAWAHQNQDEELTELIQRCKAILLSDIPGAFLDTFGTDLCYRQRELGDRLKVFPGVVVITRRGGDMKVVTTEFLTYLLVTKGFYDTFSHRQENWPSKEGKILSHLQKQVNDASSLNPLIKTWRTTAPPCLWETFSSFWISDYCITWFREGVNWRPKSVQTVLQSHQDVLQGFLEPQPPAPGPVPKTPNQKTPNLAQRSAKPGGIGRKSDNEFLLVDTPEALISTVSSEHVLFSSANRTSNKEGGKYFAAVNFRMGDGEISVIEVVTTDSSYQFDCKKVDFGAVVRHMSVFFANKSVFKLIHDLFQPAITILREGGVNEFCGCVDSQLALEYFTADVFGTFYDVLKYFGVPVRDNDTCKAGMPAKKNKPGAPPGSQQSSKGVSKPALLLWKSREHISSKLGDAFGAVQNASDSRANLAKRRLVFDKRNNHVLASRELISATRSDTDIFEPSSLVVNSDIDELLYLLPSRIRESIEHIGTENLTEVILDKGRTASAWINGKRYFLEDEEKPAVDQTDIDCITGGLGYFGSDNRAGIERQLHRVSCMRNRAGSIIGLTLRVGRNIDGIADMICDLLLGGEGSILFLGEPASGKTTVVREAARLLSEDDTNVCIIDTSNEIAGDGDVPHPCVGHARRMMVPSLDQQANIMVECVQNHAPSIMVIDEIGRPTEVEAARTCKQRGVRMIASAHGDLRKLVRNPKLKGLCGGVETVTLGDTAAKSEAKGRGVSGMHKLKSQRAGTPVFDMIVEVRRHCPHEWYITLDTAKAVDAILEGMQYEVQRRVRNPKDGSFQVLKEKR